MSMTDPIVPRRTGRPQTTRMVAFPPVVEAARAAAAGAAVAAARTAGLDDAALAKLDVLSPVTKMWLGFVVLYWSARMLAFLLPRGGSGAPPPQRVPPPSMSVAS